MRCVGFTPEQYGLYSLGSLEYAEATEISSHLDQSCETCLGEIGRDLALWAAFGEMLAPDSQNPRKRDWQSVLGRRKTAAIISWPGWRNAAAAVIAGALGFWAISTFSAHSVKELEAQVSQERARAEQLTRERDEALTRANQLSAQLQTPPPQPAAPQPNRSGAARPQQVAELRHVLADTQQQLSNAQQSLSRSQAELAQVRGQINQQETQLAAIREQQSALTARANGAETRERLALDRIQSLQSEMARLNEERNRLLAVLQLRQRQSDQTVRLISFFSIPGTRLIQLSGTESAPAASGYLLLDRNNRVLLSQSGLPVLPRGRTYQLWFVRTRGTPVVSAGLFGGGVGSTSVELNPGNLANSLSAVAITDEPSGGSPLPTGHKLLIGSVRAS